MHLLQASFLDHNSVLSIWKNQPRACFIKVGYGHATLLNNETPELHMHILQASFLDHNSVLSIWKNQPRACFIKVGYGHATLLNNETPELHMHTYFKRHSWTTIFIPESQHTTPQDISLFNTSPVAQPEQPVNREKLKYSPITAAILFVSSFPVWPYLHFRRICAPLPG
jgi:hypothetical protein